MFTKKARGRCWLVVAIMVSLGLGWTVLQAQQDASPAVDSLLPADAILYLTSDGMNKHKDGWEKTAAYEALYKTGLIEAIEKFVQGFTRDAPAGADTAKQAFETISQHGFSLAAAIPSENARPLPYFTIVLHDAAALEQGVAQAMDAIAQRQMVFERKDVDGKKVTVGVMPLGNGMEAEIGWWAAGKHLVIVAGFDAVKQTLAVADGKKPNVTTSPLWKKYREKTPDFEMTSAFWLDFAALRSKFGDFPVNIQGQQQLVKVNDLLTALGLEKLGTLAFQSGYKGRAQWMETSLDAPAPRTGLLALTGQKSMTMADLPPLPFGNSGFYASSMDWDQLYKALIQIAQNVAKLGPPEAAAQLDQMLGQTNQLLGFDPAKELFEPLGNSVCLFGDDRQGMLGLGVGLAIKVDDAKTLRTTFNKILDRTNGMFGPGELIVSRKQKQGREIVSLGVAGGMVNPSFGIDDKWLIIGVVPQAVEAFFLRVDGKLTNWKPTQSYAEAFEAMPKEFMSVSSSDPRKTYRAIVGLAPVVLPAIHVNMQRFGMSTGASTFTAADLPPAELVGKPLFPNVSVCTADDAGFHWTARTSLPAIPFLDTGGSGTVTVAAIATALLLPAVQQAREAARRTQSKNNIKQIMLAMHNFHDVHSSFPRGTHENDKLEPEKRLSWMADILPFVEQSALQQQIDLTKSWDDPANKAAVETNVSVFLNPSIAEANSKTEGVTHYVGIAGLGKDAPTKTADPKKAGIFGYERVTRIRDITDGTSNTIAISEASQDIGPWAAGGKSTIRALTTKPYINGPDGLGGAHAGGCEFGLGDGSVRFISETVDPSVMEALSTRAGAEPIPGF